MQREKFYRGPERALAVAICLVLAMLIGCASSSGSGAAPQSSAADHALKAGPLDIPQNASCGRCGMYPANYPRWQTQVIFTDGSMTPFDGCKCMFNFIFSMELQGQGHKSEDIAAVFVKDFNTGEWLNARDAYFVVGSGVMGPMGKELIPFAGRDAAVEFHRGQGGDLKTYAEITPEVMKNLMGGMKHGRMKM